MKNIIILIFIISLRVFAQTPIQLQPWLEVKGTVNGQQLGKYVTGIKPTLNFPYKAAVSKIGSTGIYSLQTQNDTAIRQIFLGENLLTGDLNNDGYTDVVMSKRTNDYDTVYIYWGNAAGIDTTNPLIIPGENKYDHFEAKCIGDINNDGKMDLIIAAPYYPPSNMGKIYFFEGPISSPIPGEILLGDTARYSLGIEVSIGNLNNDRLNDLIIRGWDQRNPYGSRNDYVNIYFGKAVDSINTKVDLKLIGAEVYSYGLSSFDVNGDGIDDLLWTDINPADGLKGIKIHYGGSQFDTIPNLILKNPGVANFGYKIANAGDMNGDGYNDVLVSAYRATNTDGYIFIFSGGPRMDSYFDAAAGLSLESDFGYSISSVGDVNGDNLADVIVGAPAYKWSYNQGYWAILKGDRRIPVKVERDEESTPKQYELYQNYPNPFNSKTKISYSLKEKVKVKLKVFNAIGQEISTLIDKEQERGNHEVAFDGTGLPSGIYYYRLSTYLQDKLIYTETKSMTLIK